MDAIHLAVGYSVPTSFAVVALWGIVAFVRNRPPGAPFWTIVAVVQIAVGIQIVVGAILFAAGGRPPAAPHWLHYAYGGLFPGALLLAAHRFGRRHEDVAWMGFGAASIVSFGLTLRALQTGLGAG